jgi:hypothetical protein
MRRAILCILFFVVGFLSVTASAIESYRHGDRSSRADRPYIPTMLLHPMPSDYHVTSFAFMHPIFRNAGQAMSTTWSGAYLIDLSLPVMSGVNVELSFPFASGRTYEPYFRYDEPYPVFGNSRVALGNIYAGIQIQDKSMVQRRLAFSCGAFFSTANEDRENALEIGALADFLGYKRFASFSWAFYTDFSYMTDPHRWLSSGSNVGLELVMSDDPIVYAVRETDAGQVVLEAGETHAWMHYGLHANVRITSLLLRAELAGLFLMTGNTQSVSDRFISELAAGVSFQGEIFRPGVYIAVPIDDHIDDIVRHIIGFKLAMVFP